MPSPTLDNAADASVPGPVRRIRAAKTTRADKPRRTQEERSAQTHARLCEAAVALLAEVGYERLTTSLIAQRAGVSKGAQAHHFPTKDDLLVAAFGHLLQRWEVRRERFVRGHGDGATMAQILRYLWDDVFGRTDYVASVELMLAARHHPSLRERLQALLSGWTQARDDTFRRLLPMPGDEAHQAAFLQLNLCVLRGLAVVGGLSDDKSVEERVLAMWTDIATAYAARSSAPGAPPDVSLNPP